MRRSALDCSAIEEEEEKDEEEEEFGFTLRSLFSWCQGSIQSLDCNRIVPE